MKTWAGEVQVSQGMFALHKMSPALTTHLLFEYRSYLFGMVKKTNKQAHQHTKSYSILFSLSQAHSLYIQYYEPFGFNQLCKNIKLFMKN